MFPICPWDWLFNLIDEARQWSRGWKLRILLLPLYVAMVITWIRLVAAYCRNRVPTARTGTGS